MERVKSKHLFNNQLDGIVDAQILERQKEAMEKLGSGKGTEDDKKKKDEALSFMSGNQSCQEFADGLRGFMTFWLDTMRDNPVLDRANKNCIHTKFTVPPRDGNDYTVPVLVHMPKHLESQSDKPAVVYAHGGGAIAGTAEFLQPWIARMAYECGVTYFSVDYRLAPETKYPKNTLDFYCALKHIIENAKEFGVDPQKIAIAGESGGGYIVMSTMVMLAQKDEGHFVKLALPGIPMIDDYLLGDPKSMTREERQSSGSNGIAWRCLATNLEEQRKNGDPLLFPAKADDELLAKMPPTIIWEIEFDVFITEATRMARRLRAAGRLLELYICPGMTHGAESDPTLEIVAKMIQDYKLALETYLF